VGARLVVFAAACRGEHALSAAVQMLIGGAIMLLVASAGASGVN
jgi:hypothetical protein